MTVSDFEWTGRRNHRDPASRPGPRGRFGGPDRGRHADVPAGTKAPGASPRWVWPALALLLSGTAALYLWNLSASGDANSFYAAAVQSGTKSWKAFFFGSSDWSNFITVDKPPASLWVMALSGRIFGFSSWSMLAPQALEGVATVAILFATVRRWFGPAAGLIAGTLLALTPVAALMFRFNNPDALLVLLMTTAAYCTVRALEKGSTRWLALAGTALGFAFLTKMMQAFLVLPAFTVVYLVCAPTTLRRRITGVLAGGAALVVSAGWWVAAVELWPAGSRPWVGGSTTNSELNLILGYNGLGRLTGSGTGNGIGGGGFSGSTGWTRLFNTTMGGEISWLLPTALIALGGALWLTRRAPRTDRTRAALLLWGLWLIVTGLVFSFGSGVIHSYYTVALAPAVAALVAVGGAALWRGRAALAPRLILAAMVAAGGGWSYVLLDRTPSWYPALRWVVLIAALATAGVLIAGGRVLAKSTAAVAIAAAVAIVAAPAAYSLDTASTAHTGSVPSSGPVSGAGGLTGGPQGAGGGRVRMGTPPTVPGSSASSGATGTSTTSTTAPTTGSRPTGELGGTGETGGMAGTGAMGGTSTNAALTALLKSSTGYTWAAATVGSTGAAGYQLASNVPVMAIGGFTGSDPTPTLAQFKTYVAAKKIHYFITGGGGGGGAQAGTSAIATWVAAHFKAVTVGGQTVYDLTSPTSS
jgi:4-amino-4-deoxy-L-arabinose transferase-like glycosyltransferase